MVQCNHNKDVTQTLNENGGLSYVDTRTVKEIKGTDSIK